MAEWYVVGGAVRDLLMGHPVHDLDFSFGRGEESFLQCFPQARKTKDELGIWLVGPVEFTPLCGDIASDMTGRDLTINAAAIDEDGRFYHHPSFVEDMESRTLRLCSPDVLEHDPLRVFRIARFMACLPDFELAAETLEAMRVFARTHRHRFLELPKERVGRELLKAFEGARPSRFFTTLLEANCLDPWFAELAPAADIPAGPLPWHDNSVFEHTLQVMDRCAGHPLAVWMALCHDLGKTRTDEAILPHHYGHELKGVDLAKALGVRLGLPSRFIRAGVVGTILHMKGGMYGSLRAGTRRDLVCQIHDARIDHDFWLLAGADGGWDWEPIAERDRLVIQSVHLPEQWRNRGAESGKRLRALQCEAISRLPKMEPERAENGVDVPVSAELGRVQD